MKSHCTAPAPRVIGSGHAVHAQSQKKASECDYAAAADRGIKAMAKKAASMPLFLPSMPLSRTREPLRAA
jgi:hypothetical protein